MLKITCSFMLIATGVAFIVIWLTYGNLMWGKIPFAVLAIHLPLGISYGYNPRTVDWIRPYIAAFPAIFVAIGLIASLLDLPQNGLHIGENVYHGWDALAITWPYEVAAIIWFGIMSILLYRYAAKDLANGGRLLA